MLVVSRSKKSFLRDRNNCLEELDINLRE